jgi:hypothetical protein
MDLFSYILILTSVIYALAVAQILEGVSRLVQSTRPVRPFLPHTLWVSILFLFIFLIWWATWEFRDVEWTFAKYAYMLTAPTLFYLVCSLLMPQKLDGEVVNLEEHFFRVRRLFFAAYFFGSLAVVVDGNVLSNEPIWHTGRIGHVLILGAAVVGYSVSNRRIHLALAVITSATVVVLGITRFLYPR